MDTDYKSYYNVTAENNGTILDSIRRSLTDTGIEGMSWSTATTRLMGLEINPVVADTDTGNDMTYMLITTETLDTS